MPPSDALLVERARRGDAEAFGELVNLYKERVYRMALQMTRNPADADELSQQAFLKAYEALPRFEGKSGFYTWLYRITANVCLTHLKTQGRHVPLPEPRMDEDDAGRPELGTTENPTQRMEETQAQREIWDALDTLGPELRAAAVLVYLQDMSPREAAKALGCAEATIHWRLFKARGLLKKVLSKTS